MSGRVMERAAVRAVAGELVVERVVVHRKHVRVQLAPGLLVARDAAAHVVLAFDAPSREDARPLADAKLLAVELDLRRPHVDDEARLAHPRQPQDPLASRATEEDRLEGGALLRVAGLVDIEDERPRRARLVVVVAAGERHVQSAEVYPLEGAVGDAPAQEAEALAVGRAAAGQAAGHPAWADRLAVARLEVGALNMPRTRSHG